MGSNMKSILKSWQKNIDTSEITEQISLLVYIGSLTQESFDSLEIEIASKICSSIYKCIYGDDFATFQEFLIKSQVNVNSFHFNIRNMSLWQAIWFNSLKNFQILPSKTNNSEIKDHTELLLWCINFILNKIDILNKNSLYLLRSLQFIINKTNILSPSLSLNILHSMNKVALSPLAGFRQISELISKQALVYIEPVKLNALLDVSLLPVKGINTQDVITTYRDDFVKQHTQRIVKKVLMMFESNIENKDGGFLYEKLLKCTFEEWIHNIWPLFLPKLQHIELEGEFFQSLKKFWIPATVSAYRTEFYVFIKEEKIDLQLKANIVLESKKKGFLLNRDDSFQKHPETLNLALKIVSTYRKKTCHPESEDTEFLMYFLYSNLSTYLEDGELNSIRKFMSQMLFSAHNSLKTCEKDFNIYEHFLNRIFKYCLSSLRTDFFQVGAQVLHIFLSIITGSHEDLTLMYKLEKKDYYEKNKNQLLITMKQKNLWKIYDESYYNIRECFEKTNYESLILTDLLKKFYSKLCIINADIIRNLLKDIENVPNLRNTEKITNCSVLLFTQKHSDETDGLVKEICESLAEKLKLTNPTETDLFKTVLYVEIITVVKIFELQIPNLHDVIQYSLELIDFVLESDLLQNISYRHSKVLETFITRVMFLISSGLNDIWPVLDKKYAVTTLTKIIQKSNMKKPVSISADLLRQFGFKMEENECDKIFKIRLLNDTLNAIEETPATSMIKIRRSPESRLVVHALCISQRDAHKPLLHWSMHQLLNIIMNRLSTDLSVSSCLHTIELLISDNRLHSQTFSYIPDIIVQCVELFGKSNWIVKNADLQLVKSLIERMYGVSMNNFSRPKSISDLFALYPSLASYFFNILSLDNVDERAVIVLQFFSESQVKESISGNDVSEILQYFQILFVHMIKTYENHYGKLTVKAYVALCLPKNVPEVFADLESFIINEFSNLPKNILANMFQLMQELYVKYKKSYDKKGIKKVHQSWSNLQKFLKTFDSALFDFLLVKVKSVDDILTEKNLKNNLWVHNNLTFLFLNANTDQICRVLLDDARLQEIPAFFMIKILSVLIERYEHDDFSPKDLQQITNSIFRKALSAEENNYLLNSYFKVLLIFRQHLVVDNFEHKVIFSTNLYKNILNLFYIAYFKPELGPLDGFFESVVIAFKNNISINEELDNDILSILSESFSAFPKKCRSDLCKIIFYLSLRKPSTWEARRVISAIKKKSFPNILEALNDFLSKESLLEILGDKKAVDRFVNDVKKYLDERNDGEECKNEFYTVESDLLVPRHFVKTMLHRLYRNISNSS